MEQEFNLEGINKPLENKDLDALLDLIDTFGNQYRDFATVLEEDAKGYRFTITHRKNGLLFKSKYTFDLKKLAEVYEQQSRKLIEEYKLNG